MKGCSVRPGETTARRVYDMPKKHLKKSAPDYPLEEFVNVHYSSYLCEIGAQLSPKQPI